MKKFTIALIMILPCVPGMISAASTSGSLIPASSGTVEQTLRERYLDTVYPPLADVFPSRALIGAPTTKKRDILIPAAAAGLGYGAGRLASFYLKSSRPDLAAFVAALATTTISVSALALTNKSLEPTAPVAPEEPIDPATIEQELAALKELLPQLNAFLPESTLEQDTAYAKQKFHLQWLAVADAYETWEENAQDAQPKLLSDFYPAAFKAFMLSHHASNAVYVDDEEFIEVDTEEPDHVNVDAIIESYTQKAAEYRKAQAPKNAQAVMERLAQLAGYAHRTNQD